MRLQLNDGFRRGETVVAAGRALTVGRGHLVETDEPDAIKELKLYHDATEFKGQLPPDDEFGGRMPNELQAEVERQREIERNKVAARVVEENNAYLNKRKLADLAGEPVPSTSGKPKGA